MTPAGSSQPPTDDVRILVPASLRGAMSKALSRRAFLGGLGALGAGAALAGCGGSSGGSSSSSSAAAATTSGASAAASGGASGKPTDLEGKLNIYTWGDYDDPADIKDFGTQFGPATKMDSYSSNEEMIAKLVGAKGTSGYDIVVPTDMYVPQMIHNDLLLKLDKSLIPNIANLDSHFVGRDWDPGNDYSVCKDWGTTGYIYDVTKITRPMATWSDFITAAQNEASGATSILDVSKDVTGIYFWANNIDWNTTDKAQLDACEEFLVKNLAPHIKAFDSYPGSGGAMAAGGRVLMQAFNGDARQGVIAAKDPSRWKWVTPGPKSELWMDNWCIAKGAPHPKAAHAFINYILDPAVSLKETKFIGYNTGIKGIEEAARAANLTQLDMVFFTDAQVDNMTPGKANDAQQRNVDIYDKVKAAAGA